MVFEMYLPRQVRWGAVMAEKQDAAVESGVRAVDPRYPAEAISRITGMRLSPGEAVTLVNMSASGVLVEGKTRFVPGTRVAVIFEGPKAPPTVKGRVVRCQVSAIAGGGSLQYQSAIAFERRSKCRSTRPRCPSRQRRPPRHLRRRPPARRSRLSRRLRPSSSTAGSASGHLLADELHDSTRHPIAPDTRSSPPRPPLNSEERGNRSDPVAAARSWTSSVLTFATTRRPPSERATFCSSGATARQGPHHGAQKSTSTGTREAARDDRITRTGHVVTGSDGRRQVRPDTCRNATPARDARRPAGSSSRSRARRQHALIVQRQTAHRCDLPLVE